MECSQQQAVTLLLFGPVALETHRDVSAGEIAEHHSWKKGETRLAFLLGVFYARLQGFQPTKSRTNIHADAVRQCPPRRADPILHGFLSRCQEKWTKGSMRRRSRLSIQCSGVKSRISQQSGLILVRVKRVILPMPDTPDRASSRWYQC